MFRAFVCIALLCFTGTEAARSMDGPGAFGRLHLTRLQLLMLAGIRMPAYLLRVMKRVSS